MKSRVAATGGDPMDPETIMEKLMNPESSKPQSSQFDIHTKWSLNDMFCLNVTTPPPGTVLAPYSRVYVRWSKTKDCDCNIPLTNFTITLYNNPKASGNFNKPKVKTDYANQVAVDVQKWVYVWDVPLIPHGTVKHMSMFYLRVETEGMVNSGMYTVFGMTGPLTLLSHPDKVNKTLFAEVATGDDDKNKTVVSTPVDHEKSTANGLILAAHVITLENVLVNVVISFLVLATNL
ncbi:2670_t:CDS:1 [Acaulospora colombiana]|uniref:2670_t:CDS:1 n=1 Tax=Acaulospora colombiana TaxID=27376 RepID=A0ACA9K2H9_9GLOM|nr:2670_t:CDS:1 [Acaulospora colombiana]